ncbi:MAG: DUF4296 domain-containing protein [Mucilaginibacter sp.]
MRKHIFLFFWALIFLYACSNTPKGIIKPHEMTALMVDVHIADGSLYTIDVPTGDSLYKYGFNRFALVFKKHHTDSTQFKKSLKYYTMHPDKMEPVYKDVIQILQNKLDSVNKLQIPTPTPPAHALPQK